MNFSIDEGVAINSKIAEVKAYGLDDDAEIRYGISGTLYFSEFKYNRINDIN